MALKSKATRFEKLRRVGWVALVFFLVGAGTWFWAGVNAKADGGWGIDAVLSRHTSWMGRFGYMWRLSNSAVGVLRERGVGRIDRTPEQPGKWRDDVRGQFRDLKRLGFKVAAFTHLPFKAAPTQPGNHLPEDLREVYQQGRFLGREFAGLVDAWEMVGEPDLGYCTDLPDRVAAYQKALYLGIRRGAAEAEEKAESGKLKTEGQGSDSGLNPQLSAFRSQVSAPAPLVLMGALGMPPGPWLERFAANGGLDYTDAYNFHFYGHAKDLTGVIEAHRAAIRRLSEPIRQAQGTTEAPLPLWITEAGIEAVSKDDFGNPERRQLQADFTISTAKQALAAEDVAVFMPFILVHDKDPFAMTLSPWKTFPAWDAYAKYTKENPWPQRALSRERKTGDRGLRAEDRGRTTDGGAVSPVVLQWLPDNATCVPKKVSGTYRFKAGQPIKGELRVYNFGDKPAKGRLEQGAGSGEQGAFTHITALFKAEGILEIPAMGMVSLPVEFVPTGKGYFREVWSAAFVEVGRVVPHAPGSYETAAEARASSLAHESRVSFGLESWAKIEDFIETPLPLRPLPNGAIKFPQIEPYAPGEQAGVWTTMNGLRAELVKSEEEVESGRRLGGDGEAKLKAEDAQTNQAASPNVGSPLVGGPAPQVSAARFWIEKVNTDPLAPAMAVATIDALPPAGFIRLQLDKPMTKERKVLVVLVDDRGQRYSIWENFGADYYGSRSDIWLNLEDIHADFWGPMSADYQFRPERIREVHLRFYLTNPNDPVRVGLSLLRAK